MSEFKNRLKQFLQTRANQGYSRFGIPVYVPSDEDLDKFEKTAKNIGIPPEWLANLVNHESAGTFNPAIQNPNGSATGLIQFISSTAADFGTSVSELKKMSFGNQLEYVSRYLKRTLRSRKATQADGLAKTSLTQPDFFMVVFYPVAIGNPLYPFPQYVSNANNGIKTPSEYLSKVYNVSQPPFPEYNNPLMSVQDYINSKRSAKKPFPMMSTGRVFALSGIVIGFGIFLIALASKNMKKPIYNR